jgi:signal peptidase
MTEARMTEALKVGHRKPRLGSRELYEGSQARPRPEYKDHVWNCAFVDAQTSDGEPFQMFTILDGYTLECLAMVAERRVSLEDIIGRLFDLFVLREVPKHIVLSGDSESVAAAVGDWLSRLPVETIVAEPGSRWEEDHAGSFGRRLRDELISSENFTTLPEAKTTAGNWRRQYNETRPQHSPLEDQPQAPLVSDAASSLDDKSSVLQTMQLTADPAGLTQPGGKLLVTDQRQDDWKTKVPKWVVKMTKVAEYVGIALVIVLMTAVVLALLAPRYGWRADTVLSGSMEPALPVGCVEVTRPVRLDTIEAGDIITFRSPTNGKLMSHRVVAVEEGDSYQFRTRGDANEDTDPYLIPAQNVVGRVCFKLSHVGYVVEYLKTPIGFILLGLCGMVLILAEMSTILEVHWKEPAQADTETR